MANFTRATPQARQHREEQLAQLRRSDNGGERYRASLVPPCRSLSFVTTSRHLGLTSDWAYRCKSTSQCRSRTRPQLGTIAEDSTGHLPVREDGLQETHSEHNIQLNNPRYALLLLLQNVFYVEEEKMAGEDAMEGFNEKERMVCKGARLQRKGDAKRGNGDS